MGSWSRCSTTCDGGWQPGCGNWAIHTVIYKTKSFKQKIVFKPILLVYIEMNIPIGYSGWFLKLDGFSSWCQLGGALHEISRHIHYADFFSNIWAFWWTLWFSAFWNIFRNAFQVWFHRWPLSWSIYSRRICSSFIPLQNRLKSFITDFKSKICSRLGIFVAIIA